MKKLILILFALIFVSILLMVPTFFNDWQFRYRLEKDVHVAADKILPWQCTHEPLLNIGLCFPRTWSMETEDSRGELLVIFSTNVSSKYDSRVKERAAISFGKITKLPGEKAQDTIRRYFEDTDRLLVIEQSSRKVGMNYVAFYVKDDSEYLKRKKEIFPIGQFRLFIDTKSVVWDYGVLYQNPTFDISPYETQIIKSFSFPE